jgi:hypothetical protein
MIPLTCESKKVNSQELRGEWWVHGGRQVGRERGDGGQRVQSSGGISFTDFYTK